MKKNGYIWTLVVLLVTGCAALSTSQLDLRFGKSEPRDRIISNVPDGEIDYWSEVKPVVEQRCVVCHGCYDAPCQLKMSSIEGIERGATSAKVYKQSRSNTAPLTRLFEDAQTVPEWRDKGFHPVLNEYENTIEANRDAGVMYRLLKLKDANPLPEGEILPDDFDLSLNRKEFCAQPDTVEKYERDYPLQGMPFALPALDSGRQTTLLQWLEQGAAFTAREPLAPEFATEIEKWEAFLNGDSLKQQLVGRYIYEHLFLAHLYFPLSDERKFFKLVRSKTPPGQPVEIIATRRPFNAPGVDRVYYRITEKLATVVAKTHMPYALDPDLLKMWGTLFIDADYMVEVLPSYDEKSASNPFLTFEAIPAGSRYRFMLERAQFSIMNFIKGPVCRGQVALNEINDHFWVFFQNPDYLNIAGVEEFLTKQGSSLELPASNEAIYDPFKYWRRYAKQQKSLTSAIDIFMADNFSDPGDISLNNFWDGDGHNQNASLTVFRHVDSASVTQGLVGQPPKTAWVIEYGLLEKIHYLLVAGYDVYGNVGHQLISRIYMDFMRMEGETAFLTALPAGARERERRYWYRGAEKEVDDYMKQPAYDASAVPQIEYVTDDEKLELFEMLKEHLAPVLPDRFSLATITNLRVRGALSRLEELQGLPVTFMPELAIVQIVDSQDMYNATIVHNRAHLNIAAVFGEQKNYEPGRDSLTVVPGVLGSYPNAFFRVDEKEIDEFSDMISALRTEADYSQLLDKFGIRRTNPAFWEFSDQIHADFEEREPVDFGLLDFNRLDNR